MRNRVLIARAIIGCLALVAVLPLLFWFGGGAMGSGTTSVGPTSVQYVSINSEQRLSLVIWSDLSGRAGSSGHSGVFGTGASVKGYAQGQRILIVNALRGNDLRRCIASHLELQVKAPQ
jgi:hypothetical protein